MSTRQTRPSNLPLFLKAEVDARGWDPAGLARRAEMDKSTLWNLMNKEGVIPKLDTLEQLALALSIPLSQLIRQAGFDLGPDQQQELDSRTADILRANPELATLVNELAQLHPDDLRDIHNYTLGRRDQRRRNGRK